MGRSRIRNNLEYAAIVAVCAVAGAVPYRAAMAVARGLGWLLYAFGLKRRRTCERIRSVFPEKSKREVREIAVRSLQNILMTAVEMMRASRLDRRWMDKHVLDGELYRDRLKELVDEGHGVVIMVPHSGNWYMAAWCMARYGLPLMSIAARQRNPKIDAWMARQYGDIEVFDRDMRDSLVKIKAGLSAGRAFAILPDLRVRRRDVEADFLGGKANVSRAGALFAVKCGSPIVVAAMSRRDGWHVFNHIATLRPDPSAADTKAEAARLTKEAMKLLSEEIVRRPGDWFWYNTRWILEPVKEEDQR